MFLKAFFLYIFLYLQKKVVPNIEYENKTTAAFLSHKKNNYEEKTEASLNGGVRICGCLSVKYP